jgi:hypothetical protein
MLNFLRRARGPVETVRPLWARAGKPSAGAVGHRPRVRCFAGPWLRWLLRSPDVVAGGAAKARELPLPAAVQVGSHTTSRPESSVAHDARCPVRSRLSDRVRDRRAPMQRTLAPSPRRHSACPRVGPASNGHNRAPAIGAGHPWADLPARQRTTAIRPVRTPGRPPLGSAWRAAETPPTPRSGTPSAAVSKPILRSGNCGERQANGSPASAHLSLSSHAIARHPASPAPPRSAPSRHLNDGRPHCYPPVPRPDPQRLRGPAERDHDHDHVHPLLAPQQDRCHHGPDPPLPPGARPPLARTDSNRDPCHRDEGHPSSR